MSLDQNKEEYIWKEGGGNPGNQNAAGVHGTGLTTDRISHVLLSTKYLQKTT